VAVRVSFIGRPVRDADGDESDERGDKVEAGMGGFGQEPERTAEEADDEFHPRQGQGGEDGIRGRPLFLSTAQFDGRRLFGGHGFR